MPLSWSSPITGCRWSIRSTRRAVAAAVAGALAQDLRRGAAHLGGRVGVERAGAELAIELGSGASLGVVDRGGRDLRVGVADRAAQDLGGARVADVAEQAERGRAIL